MRMMWSRARGLKPALACAAVFGVTLTLVAVNAIGGQLPFTQEVFTHNQNVAPAFEGWEKNKDGTFNMVFGYFNRNWEEQPDVPIGPDNNIEPGGPDRGQPTHFFPRRNKFVFRIPVPADFGTKELVWTLKVNGKMEKAYATLKPDYVLEPNILITNASMVINIPNIDANEPPSVKLDGEARRTVKVGEPLTLSASVADDGLFKPKAAPPNVGNDATALGLRVAWFVYRGAGKVTFDPEQIKVYPDKKPGAISPWAANWLPPPVPRDGKYSVKVTFSEPGTYVVRAMAHDGGLQDTRDVTVSVVR